MKWIVVFLLWIALVLFSLGYGQFPISTHNVATILWNFLTNSNTSSLAYDVVINIRLPRVLMASLCGSSLALSGLVLQAIFRNALVGPHVVGVSTGAAFGGTLSILFGASEFILFLLSFTFGVGSLVLVLLLASMVSKRDIFALILSGIVVGGFFHALIGFVQYISDDEEVLPNIVYWLLGSFSSANFTNLKALCAICLPCMVLLFFLRWRLNLLSLEDKDMKLLGIKVKIFRFCLLLLCSLLISSQVSVSGSIGWIGLVVPHFAKILSGSNHSKSVPATIAFGAIFMLFVDDIARNMIQGEIPLGILTALVGAPVFAYLMKRTKLSFNEK